MDEKSYNHQQAADSLGILLSVIGRWSGAGRGSATTTTPQDVTGQAELLRLPKEYKQLRMEREILRHALRVKKATGITRLSNPTGI